MSTGSAIDFLNFIQSVKQKEVLQRKAEQLKEAQVKVDIQIAKISAELKAFTKQAESKIDRLATEYNQLEQQILNTELLLTSVDKQMLEYQIQLLNNT